MSSNEQFHHWEGDQLFKAFFDGSEDPAPYIIRSWGGQNALFSADNENDSHYGYVFDGNVTLQRTIRKKTGEDRKISMQLSKGMYFACPGNFRLEGGCGYVVRVPQNNTESNRWLSHKPLFSVGGPVEAGDYGEGVGRLPYIDGCTDTLLIHPVVLGAPCLNHLHFPGRIKQTLHTHPSGRAGIVLQGKGRCISVEPDGPTGETKKRITPLVPGVIFVIPKDVVHAFETDDGETLDVIAFHPDSDFGPTPDDHPMLNRTYVDGVSATQIDEIRTK